VPGRKGGIERKITQEVSYPHKYAIQITTDSPQWGGLSGCTFEEAITWGKEILNNNHVQCYCDATIALPLIVQGVADLLLPEERTAKNLNSRFQC
jgi:deoxyhypusine synthase